jgi:hypothetical protein
MEKRLQLIESEMKGNLDLSQFYVKPAEGVEDRKAKG